MELLLNLKVICMDKLYYKGYWMVTNRCNLSCSYCVLENAPHQKRLELDLNDKKRLIEHLYTKLNFRRLTLSGGEISIIGKKPPHDFIELLSYLQQFRSNKVEQNLGLEIYSNGIYIDEKVVAKMAGVVDMVAMTIDSTDNNLLNEIGRKYKGIENYYKHIVHLSKLLAENNITFKLHSVISLKNYLTLPNEVANIIEAIQQEDSKVACWKFYQYMSYDAPEKDIAHAISAEQYQSFEKKTKAALDNYDIALHFKDNKEMNASLFNILSYGNAQYMRSLDTWSTSQRTNSLFSYESMEELFAKHDINETLFKQFHQIQL
jgi:sulfatase maturation enzyme AslB (radical SAM superfamily)